MAKIVKIVRTLRNNWKKSIIGCSVLSYGVVYLQNKYESSQFMRALCEEATRYGELPLPVGVKPRQVTVLLNPAANKRKAKANFEEYCAPLLNLAGLTVSVIHTEYEGQVRSFLEQYDESADAIVIAGGDGTLSEAVTGLLRKTQTGTRYPIGILPLGRTNTVANSLFADGDSNEIHLMAKATMAIIKEVTKPVDVIKIEVLQNEKDTPGKPVYSLGGVHWGAYRDTYANRDKYWYFGGLRPFVAYIFSAFKGNNVITWDCDAELSYVLPCAGCSSCHMTRPTSGSGQSGSRWWKAFLPRSNPQAPEADFSKIQNEECGRKHNETISTIDLSLTTMNITRNCTHGKEPHIEISVGPQNIGYIDFIVEGFRRVIGKAPAVETSLSARELELWPVEKKMEKERWISIDLEDYEVKPIRLTLLSKEVTMFCMQNMLNSDKNTDV